MDRELTQYRTRMTKAAESIATSLEKLASEPFVEIEPVPAQCPHCGKVNPEVKIDGDAESSGPLNEFVAPCICQSCNKPFYAFSEQWVSFESKQQLVIYAKAKAERLNGRTADSR